MVKKPVAPKKTAAAKTPAKPAPAKVEALDQTLAGQIMSNLNGSADDVFEHDIRFLSMRQEEGNVFKGMVEDKTLKTGPTSFTFHWTKPLKTQDDISKLTLHIINTIIDDYGDSDDSDDSDDSGDSDE